MMNILSSLKHYVCKDVVLENIKLREEVILLKQNLYKKQDQINAVNKYWKRVLYNQINNNQRNKT